MKPAEEIKPTLVEVFSDNGEHSHWTLVNPENGEKLWSEDPDECKAMGYPVSQQPLSGDRELAGKVLDKHLPHFKHTFQFNNRREIINAMEEYASQFSTPNKGLTDLLELLALHGGQIVSTASLSPFDIEQARAGNRMYVDQNSLGYVWEPKIDKMPETEEEVKQFEKWFPFDRPDTPTFEEMLSHKPKNKGLTAEEAIKLRDEYMENWRKNNPDYPEGDYWSGINDGIHLVKKYLESSVLHQGEREQKESGWISVSDRMPECWSQHGKAYGSGYLLTANSHGEITINQYWQSPDDVKWEEDVEVTHWQPLPSAPQEQKGESSHE